MSGFNLPPGCLETDLPGNTDADLVYYRLLDEVVDEWDATGVDETYCLECDHCCVDCHQWSMYLEGTCWAVEAEVEKRMEDYR